MVLVSSGKNWMQLLFFCSFYGTNKNIFGERDNHDSSRIIPVMWTTCTSDRFLNCVFFSAGAVRVRGYAPPKYFSIRYADSTRQSTSVKRVPKERFFRQGSYASAELCSYKGGYRPINYTNIVRL